VRTVYASPQRDLGRLTILLRTIDLFGFLLSQFKFKGFYHLIGLLSKLTPKDEHLMVVLNDNSRFLFCARDPYWMRLICSRYVYEAEIEQVLKKISTIDYAFLDCGSNLGYWAVKVTGRDLGQHSTVAIEPVPSSFKLLEENRKLNNNRFRTIQAAVYSDSGLDLPMAKVSGNTVANVGAHIAIETSSEDIIAFVQTITIEQIIRETGFNGRKLVVKLDVEGAEIPALEGSRSVLLGDLLVIYEDHGMDKKSTVSRYILDKGFVIFEVSNGITRKVDGIEQICKIKQNPRYGYNFFATRPSSSFYELLVG
jgi:FkbM family methyltransferase